MNHKRGIEKQKANVADSRKSPWLQLQFPQGVVASASSRR